jgi:hypothetical protein
MLFIKCLGVALLLGCGALGSVFLCRFERARCVQAEGFLALIRMLRLQIDCFGTPVEKILSTLDEKTRAELGCTGQVTDLGVLLQNTLLLVPQDFGKLLFDFSLSLGTGYREEELRYCEYYLSRLEPIAKRMRDELDKRVRLAVVLPLSLSAALMLLLW